MNRKVAIKEWRSWKQIVTKYLLQVHALLLSSVHPYLSFCYVISVPLFSGQLMDDEQTGAGYVLNE